MVARELHCFYRVLQYFWRTPELRKTIGILNWLEAKSVGRNVNQIFHIPIITAVGFPIIARSCVCINVVVLVNRTRRARVFIFISQAYIGFSVSNVRYWLLLMHFMSSASLSTNIVHIFLNASEQSPVTRQETVLNFSIEGRSTLERNSMNSSIDCLLDKKRSSSYFEYLMLLSKNWLSLSSNSRLYLSFSLKYLGSVNMNSSLNSFQHWWVDFHSLVIRAEQSMKSP